MVSKPILIHIMLQVNPDEDPFGVFPVTDFIIYSPMAMVAY